MMCKVSEDYRNTTTQFKSSFTKECEKAEVGSENGIHTYFYSSSFGKIF